MIKEIEMIKMRKDISYLLKNYFNSRTGMAKALGIVPKVLSDITIKKVTPQDEKFLYLHHKIIEIKQQIKEAEEYQPNGKKI